VTAVHAVVAQKAVPGGLKLGACCARRRRAGKIAGGRARSLRANHRNRPVPRSASRQGCEVDQDTVLPMGDVSLS